MTPTNWGVFGRIRGLSLLSFYLGPPKIESIYVHILRFLLRFTARQPITGISSARSLTVYRESFEVTVSGGSTFARVKLKEIDGMAPQDVERAV